MLMPNPDPDLKLSSAQPWDREAASGRLRWLGQRRIQSTASDPPFRVVTSRAETTPDSDSQPLAGQLALIALFTLAVALQSFVA